MAFIVQGFTEITPETRYNLTGKHFFAKEKRGDDFNYKD